MIDEPQEEHFGPIRGPPMRDISLEETQTVAVNLWKNENDNPERFLNDRVLLSANWDDVSERWYCVKGRNTTTAYWLPAKCVSRFQTEILSFLDDQHFCNQIDNQSAQDCLLLGRYLQIKMESNSHAHIRQAGRNRETLRIALRGVLSLFFKVAAQIDNSLPDRECTRLLVRMFQELWGLVHWYKLREQLGAYGGANGKNAVWDEVINEFPTLSSAKFDAIVANVPSPSHENDPRPSKKLKCETESTVFCGRIRPPPLHPIGRGKPMIVVPEEGERRDGLPFETRGRFWTSQGTRITASLGGFEYGAVRPILDNPRGSPPKLTDPSTQHFRTVSTPNAFSGNDNGSKRGPLPQDGWGGPNRYQSTTENSYPHYFTPRSSPGRWVPRTETPLRKPFLPTGDPRGLFVCHIDYSATERELFVLFNAVNGLVSARLLYKKDLVCPAALRNNPRPRHCGRAVIMYANSGAAAQAKEMYNCKPILGTLMKIHELSPLGMATSTFVEWDDAPTRFIPD